jgi:serine/threonine-protein kinase
MWEEELSRRFAGTSFVPLEPGAILQNGRVKIIRQLAFGGLSAIYLVQRNEIEMLVLKEAVIPANAEPESRAKAEELFDREAKFLLRLDHPQIAKVHDYFQESGRSYLLLDYIRGQDLRQLVKQNGAQPVEKVLDWGTQIISILEYLHAQTPPIIHRDLTPDNLVLDHEGKVIMIDFGAANEFVGTATGTLVGKQAYIAPEQLRGKAELRSDLYAFGGTLHFLLSGSDPEALSVSHPAETNKEVSEELDQLVAATTDMEVENRPESAQVVSSKLQELKAKHVPAPKPAAETT